jgi:hypothetical protein
MEAWEITRTPISSSFWLSMTKLFSLDFDLGDKIPLVPVYPLPLGN